MKYSLTDEHRAQLKPWADKWIANAMRTKAMDDNDRNACRIAVRGMYEAAGLKPPPDHRIVFVASPFIMRFAGGFAAAVWHLRKNNAATHAATHAATNDATRAATRAATHAATRDATNDATRDATHAATYDATYDATNDATRDATNDATHAATRAATNAATYDATYAATRDATHDEYLHKWYLFHALSEMPKVAQSFLGNREAFGMRCAQYAYRMYQGGNQWSAWDSFISFFRHIAKLPINYSKWQHWESASVSGGPRIMHPEFCIISDRPAELTVDSQNRPHNETGPFCRWRDGSALYSWHGTRVPAWIIEQRDQITVESIVKESNTEVRRVMRNLYGTSRFLHDVGAKTISSAPKHRAKLLSFRLDGDPEDIRMLELECPSTGSVYHERVRPDITDCMEALASRIRIKPAEYAPTWEC